MATAAKLRQKIMDDDERTKYILYENTLVGHEFYIPAKSPKEIKIHKFGLSINPFVKRVRVVTFKPLRAKRS